MRAASVTGTLLAGLLILLQFRSGSRLRHHRLNLSRSSIRLHPGGPGWEGPTAAASFARVEPILGWRALVLIGDCLEGWLRLDFIDIGCPIWGRGEGQELRHWVILGFIGAGLVFITGLRACLRS